jgi:hypothetical protein
MDNSDATLLATVPHATRTLKRWAILSGAIFVTLVATTANAAPVVVGSVDPLTKRVTVFEDLLVKTFADGTPILNLYGKYNSASKDYFLIRAGTNATGGCRTEAFQLVKIAGNRLAIASSSNPSIAWNPTLIPSKMFATFDCTSSDCLFCEASDTSDPLGGDPNNDCACTQTGSLAGVCTKTRPGLGGPYGPGAIVVAGPGV